MNASSAPRNCLRSELDYGEFLFRKVLGISLTIFTILIVKVRYLTKKIEKEGESGRQGYDLSLKTCHSLYSDRQITTNVDYRTFQPLSFNAKNYFPSASA